MSRPTHLHVLCLCPLGGRPLPRHLPTQLRHLRLPRHTGDRHHVSCCCMHFVGLRPVAVPSALALSCVCIYTCQQTIFPLPVAHICHSTEIWEIGNTLTASPFSFLRASCASLARRCTSLLRPRTRSRSDSSSAHSHTHPRGTRSKSVQPSGSGPFILYKTVVLYSNSLDHQVK